MFLFIRLSSNTVSHERSLQAGDVLGLASRLFLNATLGFFFLLHFLQLAQNVGGQFLSVLEVDPAVGAADYLVASGLEQLAQQLFRILHVCEDWQFVSLGGYRNCESVICCAFRYPFAYKVGVAQYLYRLSLLLLQLNLGLRLFLSYSHRRSPLYQCVGLLQLLLALGLGRQQLKMGIALRVGSVTLVTETHSPKLLGGRLLVVIADVIGSRTVHMPLLSATFFPPQAINPLHKQRIRIYSLNDRDLFTAMPYLQLTAQPHLAPLLNLGANRLFLLAAHGRDLQLLSEMFLAQSDCALAALSLVVADWVDQAVSEQLLCKAGRAGVQCQPTLGPSLKNFDSLCQIFHLEGIINNMSKEHDYQFKVAIIGNSCVGKSSLLKRYADDSFCESYLATIGVDFRFKSIMVEGKSVKLQIWDTAGQERFRTITSTYYKGAHCVFLVYDIHNRKSYEDIQDFWRKEVEKYGESQVIMCLLGNKSDIETGREVPFQQARDYAQSKKLPFFQVSAKTGDSVTEAFLFCSKSCIQKFPVQVVETSGILNEINRKKEQMRVAGGQTQAKKKCEC